MKETVLSFLIFFGIFFSLGPVRAMERDKPLREEEGGQFIQARVYTSDGGAAEEAVTIAKSPAEMTMDELVDELKRRGIFVEKSAFVELAEDVEGLAKAIVEKPYWKTLYRIGLEAYLPLVVSLGAWWWYDDTSLAIMLFVYGLSTTKFMYDQGHQAWRRFVGVSRTQTS